MDRGDRARLLSYSATFLALIAAGSWISIPFFPVPLTLQTFFVLLAGMTMGRRAVVPVALYLFLGALGLPIFHNGSAGVGILLGPTGGYALGFLPAALIAGLAYERKSESARLAGLGLALASTYLCGVLWLSWSATIPLPEALLLGVLPFIPGDLVKLVAARRVGRRLE